MVVMGVFGVVVVVFLKYFFGLMVFLGEKCYGIFGLLFMFYFFSQRYGMGLLCGEVG